MSQSSRPTATPSESPPARQRIISRARDYFFGHGFRGVTMDDLAEELGMSKKTLYAHFSSKTLLLEAVIADKFTGMSARLERIAQESAHDFPASIRELLACLQHETEEVQAPFIRDVRREAPEVFKMIQARRREAIQRHFGRLFMEGRRAGVVRKDVSVQLMIEILLGATEAIMNPTRMAELRLTPKTGFSAIVSVVLEGVLTDQRRAK
jgi:AcrR family transcriptional regulator